MQKRVAAIHDISCFGRCSLTVALPVLSAAGIETSVIPTAILSTHTGGFAGYTFRDLSDDILPVAHHWKSLGLAFDAMYSGYLGSARQIDLVLETFALFASPQNFIFVDPVMADNGKLYAGFDADFPKGMARVCAGADAIVPNLTEAALLLGEDYREGPYHKEYIEGLLGRLSELGPKQVILTGVFFNEEELGAAALDRATGQISYAFSQKLPGSYHGTGDVFGSALLAAILAERPLGEAIQVAVDFTVDCLRRSKREATDHRFGVNFEWGLGDLARLLPKTPSGRDGL